MYNVSGTYLKMCKKLLSMYILHCLCLLFSSFTGFNEWADRMLSTYMDMLYVYVYKYILFRTVCYIFLLHAGIHNSLLPWLTRNKLKSGTF